MKIEYQVITFDQAIKLFNLGINVHSQFNWKAFEAKKTKEVTRGITFGGSGEWQSLKTHKLLVSLNAYNVSELAVLLPDHTFAHEGHDCMIKFHTIGSISYTEIHRIGTTIAHDFTSSYTLASSMCNMLIYMLENKYTTADECNARLNAWDKIGKAT